MGELLGIVGHRAVPARPGGPCRPDKVPCRSGPPCLMGRAGGVLVPGLRPKARPVGCLAVPCRPLARAFFTGPCRPIVRQHESHFTVFHFHNTNSITPHMTHHSFIVIRFSYFTVSFSNIT